MKYNKDKVDEVTLALMHLLKFTMIKGGVVHAWRSFDWDTLDRLHEKGFIGDPKNKNKSVVLSDEAVNLSEKLFEKYFCGD